MGNCLVTKLKGAVDNSNLKKYDVSEILVNKSGIRVMIWGINPSHKVKVTIENGYFIHNDDGVHITEREDNWNKLQVFLNDESVPAKLSITKKYENLSSIQTNFQGNWSVMTKQDCTLSFKDFSYSPLVNLQAWGTTLNDFELKPIVSSNLNILDFGLVDIVNFSGKTMSVEKLIEIFNISPNIIENLNWVVVNLKLTGDLSAFNGYTKLWRLHLSGNPLLTGDVKTLLDNLYGNGKTEGLLDFELYNCNLITYDGAPLSKQRFTATFTSEGYTTDL